MNTADVEPLGGWTVDACTFKVSNARPVRLLKEVVEPFGKFVRIYLSAIF